MARRKKDDTHEPWPEFADGSEEPTIVSRPEVGADTSEYPSVSGDPGFEFDPMGPDSGDDDDDDEWPVRAPAKGIRLGIPAALMFAVTLVAAGFWGGAIAQKNHASASSGIGPAAFAARLRGTGANAGTGGLQLPGATGTTGTGGSSDTTGTISVVSGTTLYVLTSTNQLVVVELTPSTAVTRNAKAKTDELRPGDTVVIQGAAGKLGSVQATSVTATAKGVSSTSGGLGAGFAPTATGGTLPQGIPGG